MSRVGVVGSGYVGLVTGACLAHLGHRVTCVDKDEERIQGLTKGRVPFYEPGLEELLSRVGEGLSFSTDLPEVVQEAEVVFIAVGTPQGEDGSADLSNVAAVARAVGCALSEAERDREHPLVVVNKSTVPVGSGDYVSMLIREGIEEAGGGKGGGENGRGHGFLVASNPEFLREGSAIYDNLFPDRIVVGADSREALHTLRTLYEPIIEQSFPTELNPRPKVTVPSLLPIW
jgi:UDPglucose 6-dehydrogenase